MLELLRFSSTLQKQVRCVENKVPSNGVRARGSVLGMSLCMSGSSFEKMICFRSSEDASCKTDNSFILFGIENFRAKALQVMFKLLIFLVNNDCVT